ncbi:MAG: glutamyl-tRNA reductase [Bacillota bacterium]
MFILIVGLNYRTAPVEIREKIAFTKSQLPSALKELANKEGIEGCVILVTCNRTEIYATVNDVEKGLAVIKDFIANHCNFDKNDLRQYLYVKTLYDGIRHLFKVSSGLDSMVLGETQVLGQVKEAYEVAALHKTGNGILNSLFQKAIFVGKRVRTETLIDHNAVSISYVAVELAKQIFDNLSDKTVLVLGAGEMSHLTARHLMANGVSTIMVSNRSYERAKVMAEEFAGKAVRFDELFEYMVKADILISATSARHHIISPSDVAMVMERRNNNPLLIIDIAVPRDVNPLVGEIKGVNLYDIDELQNVVDKNLEERKIKALAAEEIIEEELEGFLKWISSLFVVPTIRALQKKAEEIKYREMERAKNRLGNLSAREEKIIGTMANSIVKQLLHEPIVNLKKYAATQQGHLYSEICQNLFNLEIIGQKPKYGVGDDFAETNCIGDKRQSTGCLSNQGDIEQIKKTQP